MRLTNAQREKLCVLIYRALVEIRVLCWQKQPEQAADLADAFHNLPKDMWRDDFALEEFRHLFLKDYRAKYPGKAEGFLAAVDEIIELGENPSSN